MLTDFVVRNFRTFKELTIQRLGRVNLIVGRNTVGKTTLLEAIWLYAATMRPEAVYQVLYDREEVLTETEPEPPGVDVDVKTLFHGRIFVPELNNSIVLGPLHDDTARFTLRLVWVERTLSSEPLPPTYVEIPEEDVPSAEGEVFPALAVSRGGEKEYFVRRHDSWFRSLRRVRTGSLESLPPFLRAGTVNEEVVGRWWDAVALRESESRIVSFLNLLAPIERITLVQSQRRYPSRAFVVRLRDHKTPQPLKSLGDGVERMFRTVLALEYTRRGLEETQLALFPSPRGPAGPPRNVLLVDEVDAGIHYSAIRDFWKTIFKLAGLNDVQVFATTHSWDCLKGFAQAVAESEENDGIAIRLEKVEGKTQTGAVIIDRDDLPIVVREEIEVR